MVSNLSDQEMEMSRTMSLVHDHSVTKWTAWTEAWICLYIFSLCDHRYDKLASLKTCLDRLFAGCSCLIREKVSKTY